MNADVCVKTRGTWEQGFKERPVLIARDMINSSETGKHWGMFCFHQNQSTDDSMAENLQSSYGRMAARWQHAVCAASLTVTLTRSQALLASYPKWGRTKQCAATSSKIYNGRLTKIPRWKINISVTPEIHKRPIQNPMHHHQWKESQKMKWRFDGNCSLHTSYLPRILGDIYFGACACHVCIGSVIFFLENYIKINSTSIQSCIFLHEFLQL